LLNRTLPLLPLGVLTLLVVLTFWLSSFVDNGAARKAAALRHDPDLIIEKFSARTLNETGTVQYTVSAEKMMHYPDDDSSLLADMVFTSSQPGQPKLTARAPQGQLLKGGDEIIMSGDVVVDSNAIEKMPAMTIKTPKLTALPKQHIISSKDGVVIERIDGTLKAATLELNNATREIKSQRGSMTFKPPK
jgi:lipopolysaccharide export system protein LptC